MVALALNYYRRNPAAAMTLLRDPVGTWCRLYDRAGMYLDGLRSRPAYRTDRDWEARLLARLGLTPASSRLDAFAALWPEVIGLLEVKGLRTGPESFFSGNDGDPEFVRALWHLVGALHPDRIVETGVAHGVTTRFILEALRRNGAGHLWSIDLAPTDPAMVAQVGAAVEGNARSRWSFIEGSSRRRLPSLLRAIEPIDMFIHDSLHTTPHVRFELETAWRALRPGGYIAADDIDTNRAFRDFLATHAVAEAWVCQSRPIRPDRRRPDLRGIFGVIRKPD